MITKSPFFRSKKTTQNIMADVLIALSPVTIMAVILFGLPSLIRLLLGVSSTIGFEFLLQTLLKKSTTVKDLSAAVTGLLLALSLPPTAPWWIVLFGTFVFMVTDYTSGPLNNKARVYYALLIGIITGLLRYAFALPGGIGVAILVGNLLAPIIDLITTPRVFGHRGRTFPINSTFRR